MYTWDMSRTFEMARHIYSTISMSHSLSVTSLAELYNVILKAKRATFVECRQ